MMPPEARDAQPLTRDRLERRSLYMSTNSRPTVKALKSLSSISREIVTVPRRRRSLRSPKSEEKGEQELNYDEHSTCL